MNRQRRLRTGRRAGVALASVLLAFGGAVGADAPTSGAGRTGDDFLDRSPFHEVALILAPEDVASLRAQPRSYVDASVRVDALPPVRARVRLRGSSGSFRPVDDRPAWTLDFAGVGAVDGAGEVLPGVERLQLGNGVEDPGLWDEWAGARLFRAAGIPAPRVVRARVRLNGRALGLYVLKEGFSRGFLARHFVRPDGALYDNDAGCDVDQSLHLALAGGVRNGEGAVARAAAWAGRADPAERWGRLAEVVDRVGLADFLAVEVMLGHRDGYGLARNNFRIYDDPATGRMVFLPDGLDQLWEPASLPWNPAFSGLLGKALTESSEGRALYAERFRVVFAHLLAPAAMASWEREIDAELAALRPRVSGWEFAVLHRGADHLKRRMQERARALRGQLADPGPPVLAFSGGRASIESWTALDDPEGRLLARVPAQGGRGHLTIRAERGSGAAWCARFRVPEPGVYRLEARVRVEGVRARPGAKAPGGGLRLAGRSREMEGLLGTSDWQPVTLSIPVLDAARPVEVRCELAAVAGRFWIDVETLRLARVAVGAGRPET